MSCLCDIICKLSEFLYKDMFLKYGGNILDNHQVSEVIPGPVVTVVTNKGTFQTKQLVITAGAWTKVICSKLGVQLPFEVHVCTCTCALCTCTCTCIL